MVMVGLDPILTSLCEHITHEIDELLVNLRFTYNPELSWRKSHLRVAYKIELDNSWVEECYDIICQEILMEIKYDILTRFKIATDRTHLMLKQINDRDEFNAIFDQDSFVFLSSFFATLFRKINPNIPVHSSSLKTGEVFLHPCADWFYQDSLIVPRDHGAIFTRDRGVTYTKEIDANTLVPQIRFRHDFTISIPRSLKVTTVAQDEHVPF